MEMYSKINEIDALNFMPLGEKLLFCKKVKGEYLTFQYDVKSEEIIKIDLGDTVYSYYFIKLGDLVIIKSRYFFYAGTNINNLTKYNYTYVHTTGSLNTILVIDHADSGYRHNRDFILFDLHFNQLLQFNKYRANNLTIFKDFVASSEPSENTKPAELRLKIDLTSIKTGISETIFDASKYHCKNKDGNIINELIQRTIKLSEETILIQLRYYRIMCLNIVTRKIEWEIENFIDDVTASDRFFISKITNKCNFIYDKDGERVLIFYRTYIWSIDLKTKKIHLFYSQDSVPIKERWFFRQVELFDGKIYFIGGPKITGLVKQFGVFCLKNKKVVWNYRNKNTFRAMYIDKDYIYCNDRKFRLHIFKRRIEESDCDKSFKEEV